jgi:hypothetical protein
LETTAQLKSGAKKEKVDPAVRSGLSNTLNQRLIGQGTAQSDIIHVIDATEGVDFQTLPMSQMGYADGSRKIRESVEHNYLHVGSLDSGGNQVYILTDALQYPTTDGGGLETEHRGVFQNDEVMSMAESLLQVGSIANEAYIIGADGASIEGYSDDVTLLAEGFVTAEDIVAERLKRTANRVVVSLSAAGDVPDTPEEHIYACSYVIRNDVGPHDIIATDVEFNDLGNFTLTIREV